MPITSFRQFSATASVLIALCFVLAAPAEARPATDNELQIRVQRTLKHHILPNLRTLSAATKDLETNIIAYCDTANDDKSMRAWKKVRASFSDAITAWAKVQHLRFGPMTASGRRQRMALWPDPRGITGRQLRRVLRDQNEDFLQPAKLSQHSAALQGLTTLEHLLIKPIALGDPATKAERYKCGLAKAIASNIVSNAQDIFEGWTSQDGWVKRISTPGPDTLTISTTKKLRWNLSKRF